MRSIDAIIETGQQQVLELLATGASLSHTLTRLLLVIEEKSPGMLGLILLLDDERRLRVGAGPSLPADYLHSVEGLEIGPRVGSCGTAAFSGKRVIVSDIANDARWKNLRALALTHDLRACWSEPVFAPDGRVIGTFAMYYREPRTPTDDELQLIETGAHLAGIAIQRRRTDEALRESERRLFTLMSNLPGIAYRCRNEPGWPMTFVSQGSMELTGYTPSQLMDGGAVTYGDLVHPEERDKVWRTVQQTVPTREPYQIVYRIRTADGEEKWVWEQGRGVYDDDGELMALEGFITDATERVLSQQTLEQRVEERTRQLSTLLQVSQDVSSTLDLGHLVELILDQLQIVLEYEGASVLVLDDHHLEVRAYRGPIPQDEALQIRFPVQAAGANRDVIEGRRPVCIPDVYDDTAQARAFRATAGNALKTTFDYVRSWLGVPLVARDRVLGMLSLDHSEANAYSEQHGRLALLFANQVAIAIENARLFGELERRTQTQEALYQADEELYSHLELNQVLRSLVDVAVDLLQADKSSLMVWDRAHKTLVARAARGFSPQTLAQMRFEPGEGVVGRVAVSGEPAIVEDADLEPRTARRVTDAEQIRSYIHLPLQLNGEIFGVFNVSYLEPRAFDDEDCRLFTALAQRAALAIENARLYRAAERRADEAQTLINVQRAITSNRKRTLILQLIADEACRLTGARRTVVFMRRDGVLEISVLSGYEDEALLGYRMSLQDSLSGRALRAGRPFRTADARLDPHVSQEAVRQTGARSVLTVPLLSGGEALGAITALNKESEDGGFDDEDEHVMQMLAAGAVVALENARLFEEEQDRRRVAEGLRDLLSVVNANAPLQETLQYIVNQAVRVLDADAGILFRLDPQEENIVIEATAQLPHELQQLQVLPLVDSAANRASLRREPATIPDLRADMAREADALADLAPEYRRWLEVLAEEFGAYLSVPFVVDDAVHGDITLYYGRPRTFSEEDKSLAVAFGEQASLVVENAHLRMQAEASAASEERTRLARELHDAVTQTLFSASLIAEVTPRLWEKDPEQGRRRLEELRELTRGALAEMRTLLLELRPDTLTESSLPDLLRQLSEAVTGRSRLPVTLNVQGNPELPPKVQVVFYRVAQEALNNITKHAGANQVHIDLTCAPQQISLTIADDGRGFEQGQVAPNSLGLSIMRERAAEIGATLEIASTVGQGTTVRCTWPTAASRHPIS